MRKFASTAGAAKRALTPPPDAQRNIPATVCDLLMRMRMPVRFEPHALTHMPTVLTLSAVGESRAAAAPDANAGMTRPTEGLGPVVCSACTLHAGMKQNTDRLTGAPTV